MRPSALTQTLADARGALAWWTLGLVGLVAMLVAVFPPIRGNDALKKLVEDYPSALKAFVAFGGTVDYTSATGYLGSELFAFTVPLVLLIAAIGAGARAIAGEEEQGTLDLLLANPIGRSRLVLEKLGALAAETALLGLVLLCTLVVATRIAGMGIGAGRLAAAVLDATLLALLFGALALAVGSAMGRRAAAIAVPAAAAVAAYVVNALGVLVPALGPLQKASPFHLYVAADPLHHGVSLGHDALLLGAALLVAAAAPFTLARRDLH